jgi:methyltransferase (TIGR00027 family)
MKKNQTSLTAMGIAVLRAVESEKPREDRICDDPYARRFVPGWFYQMMRFFMRTGYAEWRGKGVVGFLAARDRYFDDYLSARLAEGFDQLVLLGAGYDSRAYRFEALKTKVQVFEVDHPATQQVKLERVRQIFGRLPGHVRYVAIDFNHQTLSDCLLAHGYDPRARTVFLWQGVTYYLDPPAVDRTLAFISRHSGPGSSLVFDYIDAALLQGPPSHGEVRNMQRYRGMTGEDLRFGIPVAQIEPFLSRRGFQQIKNVRSEELKALYFHGKNQARSVTPGYAIVSAVVQSAQIEGGLR